MPRFFVRATVIQIDIAYYSARINLFSRSLFWNGWSRRSGRSAIQTKLVQYLGKPVFCILLIVCITFLQRHKSLPAKLIQLGVHVFACFAEKRVGRVA